MGRPRASGTTPLLLALAASTLSADVAQGQLAYPPTCTVDHVDVYHGTTVPDPLPLARTLTVNRSWLF